ncbi:sigma-70 family RNA polymerase sigma factor [Streptomyces sp. NPDC092296]|uniref:sigma-70 family RNA polymerase sigma factor n=1 Tax=Streptomyces sp. NPDC092296 TaxID=3366012 RepID=UPI00382F9896
MGAEDRDGRSRGPHDGLPEPVPGQVPGQGWAPSEETVAGAAGSPRVPGQAPAGFGGVTSAAAAPVAGPAGGTTAVPAPADPVDGPLPPSDAELTALVRGGDDRAYEELYRRHADAVRRYARTCCRDRFTAEDLAGEVFARTLQALRGGKGPDVAVRAYLLTAVRNVAAAWTRSERREQLVEDFTDFAASSAAKERLDITDPGADAWAMAMADQRMVVRAFVGLPEDDRVVLWHTEVERESPKQVAVLLGKTANATAVQAHRARDRLATAFLQAHVSAVQEEECRRHADRLGAFARGSLRKRAAGEVGAHLKGCDRCSAAYLELVDLNTGLRAVLPGGVLVWIGVGYFSAAAAAMGAGAVAAGAGAAATASATGGTAGGAAGTAAGAGAAGGGAGGSGGGGAGAAAEGLGTAAKAAVAASVAVAAAAALAYALAGSSPPAPVEAVPRSVPSPVAAMPSVAPRPTARPVPAPAAKPASTPGPTPPVPPGTRAPVLPPVVPQVAPSSAAPVPTPTPAAVPVPTPTAPLPPVPPTAPKPSASPRPSPTPRPTPPSTPTPTPTPTAVPTVVPTTPSPSPPAPVDYWLNELPYGGPGAEDDPVLRRTAGNWLWRRGGLEVGGTRYGHGVTVRAPSAVTVDLNRDCSAFDAVVGVDDLARGFGRVVFSVVDGDSGGTLWSSPPVRGGDAAVPVHVPLTGQRTVLLVADPDQHHHRWRSAAVADWAEARFDCGG